MKNRYRSVKWITLANGITLFRILLVPIILISIKNGYSGAALLLTSIAVISDFADGRIARRTSTETTCGACLDPVADLVLVAAIQIVAAGNGWWPVYLIALSCLSFASFILRSAVAGRISGSKLGKYVGAVLMGLLLACLFSMTSDPERWFAVSQFICPAVGVYLAVSILNNFLSLTRREGVRYETN